MADDMLLTDEQFATLKMYVKVDQGIEDDMLKLLINDAGTELSAAIKTGSKPEDYLSNPEVRDRFFTALMKQVKEDYDYRGMGAEVMRFPLQTSTTNIINQLRSELPEEDGDPDAH
ncbi:head-tail connector protein [Lactobacillus phage Lrm1]|uniref:DNA packaging protein n=1 Tax=Lactobacillus phage Lrm1 TaxID=496874 RepID=B4XYP7_9CAUD|nr:head-tail connector protein [Lactobacillus phage Lrm1]ABY84308.1 DNA packaging protein [Lactobacillus phage Lrm1]